MNRKEIIDQLDHNVDLICTTSNIGRDKAADLQEWNDLHDHALTNELILSETMLDDLGVV